MRNNENIILQEVTLQSRRPRELFAREAPELPRSARIALGTVLIALHGLALWAIARLDTIDDGLQMADSALLVSFIARPDQEREAPETTVVRIEPPQASHQIAARAPAAAHDSRDARATRSQRSKAPTALAEPRPLRDVLFTADGRPRLPQATLDAMAKVDGGDREFSYQVPGLDRADKLLEHHTVLEYRETRFAKMYRPTQDVLTDVLTRLVEATTPEVRIPAPGNPKATIVCRISLLALGGACGIEDGDGWLPPGDDPNTLSPEEDRACQAWWDKIVAATSQGVWRKTRALYETQCRKPLERKPPQPPVTEPAPAVH